MPASTGSFSNHLAPDIIAILGTNLRSAKTWYSQFLTEETGPARNYFDDLAAAGLPAAVRKLENDPIQTVDPLEGSTKRVTYEEWALGFSVTQTAWEDDQHKNRGSALRAAATGLSTSLLERREIEAHRPYGAEGFDGATYLVLPDNSGFIATSHSPITGGEAAAQANRPSTDVAFSITAYRNAVIAMMKFTDDRGLRIGDYCMASKLIIPPDLKFAAEEIFQSPMRPDTTNQVVNVTKGDVTPIPTPYLTDTNNWVIQCAKHFLKFYRRTSPRFDNFDDRLRRTGIFVAWERYKVETMHWLGHYGSAPA